MQFVMDEVYTPKVYDACASCGIIHTVKKVIPPYQSAKIFAIDLMSYMCNEFDVEWQPPESLYYEHYSMTHFTIAVREAVKIQTRNREMDFLNLYNIFPFNELEDYAYQFVESIEVFLKAIFHDRTGVKFLRSIACIARAAIHMHRKKLYFDLNFAVEIIRKIVYKYSFERCPDILNRLDSMALILIENHQIVANAYASYRINERTA